MEDIAMRKVILVLNTSLDGFLCGPAGEMGWMVDDEEMDNDFTTAIRERADTILVGRKTYESFEAAWPARAADPSGFSPQLAVFSRWMVETPIVVFSHDRPPLGMSNARLATRPLGEEIAELKTGAGGDLMLTGGASTVAEAVRLRLVDEYWFKVMPVAIGRGLPVFGRVEHPADLTLVWSKVYPSGVLGLRYETAESPDDIVRNRWTRTERREKV
jgi:dihydrofolate reductase